MASGCAGGCAGDSLLTPRPFGPAPARHVCHTWEACLHAAGYDLSPQRVAAIEAGQMMLPRAERVCLVVVDGMGFHNLAARRAHTPTLRTWTSHDPLESTTPSTTAAAITSIGTGALPGRTSMCGYSLRVPGTRAEHFSLISWDQGMNPRSWQTVPTLAEELGDDAAATMAVVQPRRFVDSGLTLAALRGMKPYTGETLEQRVHAAAAAFRDGARAVYFYWGDIDHAGHKHGWQSDQWLTDLEIFDGAMRHLAGALPAGTVIAVTADHGMIDVEKCLDIAPIAQLSSSYDLCAGEGRALQLYTDDPEGVAQAWRDYFGDAALVLTQEELVATGILGEVDEHMRAAAGDVWCFPVEAITIADSRFVTETAMAMPGVHGGRSSWELDVPWIVEVV